MMGAEWATVLVPLILFLATIIRSSFGFGEALVAVPLLALVTPVEIAVPVAVLASITVALIAVVQDWHLIHFRDASRLVLSTIVGIPIGLWLLKVVPEPVIKGVLAVIIIAFSTYSLLSSRQQELKTDRSAWLFGFTAGILGGAYGVNGPPLVIYGSLRRWSPQQFRATLQGYFLPASALGMCGFWIAGIWTPTVNRFYLLSLAPVIVATFLGRVINRNINARQFIIYVHLVLIGIGIILMMQAMGGRLR
jgi:uncharacterized membrane protein YfcA